MKMRILAVVAALVFSVGGSATQVAHVYANECGAGMFLAGNGMPNVINGGPQNDEIHGGGGNDVLRGGPCDDKIFGGAGDDDIYGGAGFDYCNGGAGADTFTNCEVVVP